ncbi:hypothetical protein [Marinobacter sp. W-8]|uniref:hypothetical protein n=1 Tax=Marinobacter sp. W-8 TaxID=3369658 RepID=UPI0037C4F525
MTLTSDFPPSIVAARELSLPLNDGADSGGSNGLQFIAEPGYTLTGTVGDLETLTISGQDFGTKSPPRHFDRIDRYWANGTEYDGIPPTANDGDPLQVGSGNAFLGTPGVHMGAWRLRQAAARLGRPLGYQLETGPNSGSFENYGVGTTKEGFAGWPSSQKDAEESYIRYWRFQKYFGTDGDIDAPMALVDALPAGSTMATISASNAYIGNSVGGMEELYIVLDTGELHYCIQQEPVVSGTVFNFLPALPSPASAGNPVYRRKNAVNKNLRLQDDGSSAGKDWNAWTFSGFQGQISNDKWSLVDGKPQARFEVGKWELHEYYVRAPKDQARLGTDYIKRVRINGELRMNLNGFAEQANPGALIDPPTVGWPSSGVAITNFGFEEDRLHVIPNNEYRLSDIYIDASTDGSGARRRVEIGIGNDDLYQCAKRECCPINSWNTSIEAKLNALPFTEAELAQARIFVVDENDTAALVGRIQE